MLSIAGLQRCCQERKDAYVAQGGSPDAFDQAFDDVDISVAVDGWSSLDAELAKYLHEDIGKGEEIPTVKELKEMIKSHEEQEREIDAKYAQYLADLEKGSPTPTPTPTTPVRPSRSPEEWAKLDFDFRRWVEQRSLRYAKPKEKWSAQDREFMGWTFDEWKDRTSSSRKGPSPSAITKGESESESEGKAKDLFTGRTLDGYIEASRTTGLDRA
jgi:hypothetical protein